MNTATKRIIFLSALAVGTASMMTLDAKAQLAVYDGANVAQAIKEVQSLASQLQTLQQQLQTAQDTYQSLNKLTDLGQVVPQLLSQDMLEALPPSFSQLAGLADGGGYGTVSGRIQEILKANTMFDPASSPIAKLPSGGIMSTYRQQIATSAGVAQETYENAAQRSAGIDQLRQQIASAQSPKEIYDLQARLLVEIGQALAQLQQQQSVLIQTLAAHQTAEEQSNELATKFFVGGSSTN